MTAEAARISILRKSNQESSTGIGQHGAVTGGDRLRPIRLRPISISANFWRLNFGTTKGGPPEGWRPQRVEPRRVEAQTKKKWWGPVGWSPERWGVEKGGAQRVEPRGAEPRRGGGPKISRYFSLLRDNFFSSFSLLGSLRGILVVFEAPGP